MTTVPSPTRRAVRHPEPDVRDEISVIARPRRAGGGVAELWSGSALLGILHEEHGTIVLRLESHAEGPLALSAVALEHALADARMRLLVSGTTAGSHQRVDA